MDAIVDLRDVTLFRGEKTLLSEVSWQIRAGEHWAVLGANGSGKTTLMRIVSGMLWPSRGSVSVLGKRFGRTDLRELRKDVGWVSSALQARIPTTYFVDDIVLSGVDASIGVYRNPADEDRKKAEDVSSLMAIGDILTRTFGTLSTGEQQRVLIARALMAAPRFLVLDEPCAGLDPAAREHLLATLEAMTSTNPDLTLVYVTHHVEEITRLFTHALLLKDGITIAKGKVAETLSSDTLSTAFDLPLILTSHRGRFALAFDGERGKSNP